MAGEQAMFVLGVQDDEKGRAFYSNLFGWDFRPGPNQGFEIGTAGIPGGIHGGDKGASPYIFFAVDDMDAPTARVKELGGQLIDMDIEGDDEQQAKTGRFKLCVDDQGSGFGLHQRP